MSLEWWEGRTIFLSGASGFWGTEICRQLLAFPVRRILAYLRGEFRGAALYDYFGDDRLRLRLGDIRDKDRVRWAMEGADVVIHGCALKRVDQVIHNTAELIQTNITGTMHVIDACVQHRPEKALFISSDKAVAASTTYGATKFLGEQLWLAGNEYAPPPRPCAFAVLRCGNVLGSTGSVLSVWRRQKAAGQPLTITDATATRFHITISEAVRGLLTKVPAARGGEIFLPPMRSYSIGDLAAAFAPGYPVDVIGTRGYGEKYHELIEIGGLSSDRAPRIGREELRSILEMEGLV